MNLTKRSNSIPTNLKKASSKPRNKERATIDLRPHYDHVPYTVHELLPMFMVTRLFRSMGLRHLCVLNSSSCVCGVITRKDFAKGDNGTGLQHHSTYAHLGQGGLVQKRMLDASHQVERMKVRRSSIPGATELDAGKVLTRGFSEPSLLQLAAAKAAAQRMEEMKSSSMNAMEETSVHSQMARILKGHVQKQLSAEIK